MKERISMKVYVHVRAKEAKFNPWHDLRCHFHFDSEWLHQWEAHVFCEKGVAFLNNDKIFTVMNRGICDSCNEGIMDNTQL